MLRFLRDGQKRDEPLSQVNPREVKAGLVVFSFVHARIVAIGIVQSYCRESPKPTEFGSRALTGRILAGKYASPLRHQRIASDRRITTKFSNRFCPIVTHRYSRT